MDETLTSLRWMSFSLKNRGKCDGDCTEKIPWRRDWSLDAVESRRRRNSRAPGSVADRRRDAVRHV